MPLKVIIVGAGLGGLAAAIAFTRAGHDVEVGIDRHTHFFGSGSDPYLGFRKILFPQRSRRSHSPCSKRHQSLESMGL